MARKHLLIFGLVSLFIFSATIPNAANGAYDCTRARAWYDKGNNAKNNNERAIFYFKKAIELCPDYIDAHINLSKCYMQGHEYKKAANVCRKGLEIDPFSPDLHMILGSAYKISGEFGKAKVEYEKATELDPEDENSWKLLGRLYLYILYSNYDAAAKAFEKAYSIKAEAITLYYWSNAFYKMHDYSNAIEKARLCVEHYPNMPLGYNMLSWIYSSSKDAKYLNSKKAIDHANKVQHLEGPMSWKLSVLAAALARNNEFVTAVSSEAKSIENFNTRYWGPTITKLWLNEKRFRLKQYKRGIPYTNGDFRP